MGECEFDIKCQDQRSGDHQRSSICDGRGIAQLSLAHARWTDSTGIKENVSWNNYTRWSNEEKNDYVHVHQLGYCSNHEIMEDLYTKMKNGESRWPPDGVISASFLLEVNVFRLHAVLLHVITAVLKLINFLMRFLRFLMFGLSIFIDIPDSPPWSSHIPNLHWDRSHFSGNPYTRQRGHWGRLRTTWELIWAVVLNRKTGFFLVI